MSPLTNEALRPLDRVFEKFHACADHPSRSTRAVVLALCWRSERLTRDPGVRLVLQGSPSRRTRLPESGCCPRQMVAALTGDHPRPIGADKGYDTGSLCGSHGLAGHYTSCGPEYQAPGGIGR